MASVDNLQKQHEAKLSALLAELAGKGGESDLALVRALIHRGVHLAAERKAIEFCALATFLGEIMVTPTRGSTAATRTRQPTTTSSARPPLRSLGSSWGRRGDGDLLGLRSKAQNRRPQRQMRPTHLRPRRSPSPSALAW